MDIFELQVKLYKALAHPVRLNIVKKLTEQKLCVCELNNDIDFSQSNLSQHLKILKEARIVKSEKDGLRVTYSIYDDDIKSLIYLAEELIKKSWKSDF